MAAPGAEPDLEQVEAVFQACVSNVLGRWTALQMAISEQWGGPDSEAAAAELEADVHSWFEHRGAKAATLAHELDELLLDGMCEAFEADVADGSTRQLAHRLCQVHAACCQGNLAEAQRLAGPPGGNREALARSTRAPGLNDDDSSDGEDGEDGAGGSNEADDMDMDCEEPAGPPPLSAEEIADGWEAVPTRKGRGGRH